MVARWWIALIPAATAVLGGLRAMPVPMSNAQFIEQGTRLLAWLSRHLDA
ncbi:MULTISPECIES: hypothetical protein [unclassified Cryobacterium]|nr:MULTISPECIES: hypothetical protein [unclassified Cryobacterium]